MKRVVYFLTLIVLLPLISAEVSLTTGMKESYNIGEGLFIGGFIKENISMDGILSYVLSCGNSSVQVAARSIRLNANEEKDFSETIKISDNLIGSCKIIVNLIANNISDSVASSTFTITKELQGNFDISRKEVQLGEEIQINGNVLRLDNSNVNGIATIYIKKDGVNYILDTSNIVNGDFTYTTKLLNLPAGDYTIDVDISDINGNRKLFENVVGFKLIRDLVISIMLDKESYLPEEIVLINGTVQKLLGGSISDTNIRIRFENQEYETNIIDSKFKFNIPLAKNIKSYYHNISFYAEDGFGNFGGRLTTFYVIPIPTTLETKIDKTNYLPSESVVIVTNLYDQADDILDRVAYMEISYGNRIIFEKNFSTKEVVNLKLSEFSPPGKHIIETRSESLVSRIEFSVDTVEKINVSLSGQVLGLRNIGNIRYVNPLSIKANDKTFEIGISLGVNESTSIDLVKYLEEGTYDITVLDKAFKAVTIVDNRNIVEKASDGLSKVTGGFVFKGKQAIYKTNIPGYFVLSLIIIIILYSIYKATSMFRKKDKDKPSFIYKHKADSGQDLGISFKSYKEPKREPKHRFGRATEADIADFKREMLKKIKDDSDKPKDDI